FRERQHRLNDARAAAERALALNPHQPGALLLMTRLERRAGDITSARNRLETSLARRDNASHRIELGFVLESVGEYDAAYAAFAQGKQRGAEAARAAGTGRSEIFLDRVEQVRSAIPRLDFRAWPIHSPNDSLRAPAFFVGFPRSGTTLM